MTWRTGTMGDLVALQRGHDLTEADRKPGDVPVVGAAGPNGFHSQPRATGPGVVVGRSGGSIGKVTYVPCDFWPHNTCLYVTDFKGNHPRFVAYLLSTLNLAQLNSGAAQPSLNRNFVYPVNLRFPDPTEQHRIASILSAYDGLIENNRRRIQLLEQAARLLYKEWFVHLRFPGHEHVKITAGVPEGWERRTIPDIIEVNPKEIVSKGTAIRYLPMAGLSTSGMTVDLRESEIRTKPTSVRYRNGDVLLARITPCLENGKTGFVNFLAPDEIACGSTEFIVLRGRFVSQYFTYCLSRTHDFRETAIKSMIGSSGRQRVQPSCFDDYMIGLAPRFLLDQFDEAVAPIFHQIGILMIQVRRLIEARDIFLPRLMNGEIET
ncbi:MAG: restriction endonuclease subunit S [Sedimentisphaerales bacterium]|nr:restriction endonuclease subunit S [Sedimentisphaerales bacterium]